MLPTALGRIIHLSARASSLLVFESRLFTARDIYRSRHFSHTKIPFGQRTSFFRYDKSSGGPFSGEYVAEQYCDNQNAFGTLKTHVISENSENSFFIRNVYPSMTEKLNSIRYQIKTNSFPARQRKAGAVLKRINWIAFVRKKVDQKLSAIRKPRSCLLVLINISNKLQPTSFYLPGTKQCSAILQCYFHRIMHKRTININI